MFNPQTLRVRKKIQMTQKTFEQIEFIDGDHDTASIEEDGVDQLYLRTSNKEGVYLSPPQVRELRDRLTRWLMSRPEQEPTNTMDAEGNWV